MKKFILSCLKMNLCVCVRLVCWMRAGGSIKYSQLVILFAIKMQINYSSKIYSISKIELQMLHNVEHTVTILSIVYSHHLL